MVPYHTRKFGGLDTPLSLIIVYRTATSTGLIEVTTGAHTQPEHRSAKDRPGPIRKQTTGELKNRIIMPRFTSLVVMMGVTLLATNATGHTANSSEVYPFELPELDYEQDALEPYISSEVRNMHGGPQVFLRTFSFLCGIFCNSGVFFATVAMDFYNKQMCFGCLVFPHRYHVRHRFRSSV